MKGWDWQDSAIAGILGTVIVLTIFVAWMNLK